LWFNEFDPQIATWLRELIRLGEIPGGVVDERSIVDVRAGDVPETAHFFAGIGGWAYALRLAGWPESAPVWTGSCPCQPFSSAGKRRGDKDPRHLWPVWFPLIRERRPGVIFGEQVSSPDGLVWLDGVFADLESAGYACAAADLCAASINAPHPRHRLYWVAYAPGFRFDGLRKIFGGDEQGDAGPSGEGKKWRRVVESAGGSETSRVENPSIERLERRGDRSKRIAEGFGGFLSPGSSEPNTRLGDAASLGRQEHQRRPRAGEKPDAPGNGGLGNSSRGGFRISEDASQPGSGGHAYGPGWDCFDLIPRWEPKSKAYVLCRVESGSFPLVTRLPPDMGRGYQDNRGNLWTPAARRAALKGYGNAIVPGLAAEFIRAFLESGVVI